MLCVKIREENSREELEYLTNPIITALKKSGLKREAEMIIPFCNHFSGLSFFCERYLFPEEQIFSLTYGQITREKLYAMLDSLSISHLRAYEGDISNLWNPMVTIQHPAKDDFRNSSWL